MYVTVRENNVDQALRVLKKKLQREGVFREMKNRRAYEKPSERRAREAAESTRRVRKLMRKRMERDRTTRKLEEASMKEALGDNEPQPKGFCHKQFRTDMRRMLMPMFTCIIVVLILIPLAYRNRAAYELVSTLLWYSCLVFVTWVPIRDTAALAVLGDAGVDAFEAREIEALSDAAFVPVAGGAATVPRIAIWVGAATVPRIAASSSRSWLRWTSTAFCSGIFFAARWLFFWPPAVSW